MNNVKNKVDTIIATAKVRLNINDFPAIFKCGVTKISPPKSAPMQIVSKKIISNIGYCGLRKSRHLTLHFFFLDFVGV
jgi:hypothetical protein